MTPDELEIWLESVNKSSEWRDKVSLYVQAYPSSDDFPDNTLILDGNPVGSNCERTYRKLHFPTSDSFAEIHDFIAYHLKQNDSIQRSTTLPLSGGTAQNIWAGSGSSDPNEIDEITLTADDERISFGAPGQMSPTIRYHEVETEDGPQDRRNAERLLTFVDELSSSMTDSETVDLHDGELVDRCVPHYERGEYQEALRLAGQIMEERIRDLGPESLAEKSGHELITAALTPEDGSITLASHNGEQNGLKMLFDGAYQSIRNPLSHRTVDPDGDAYLDELDAKQARNALHLFDYLMTTLDRYHDTQTE
ncbi:TIGR02391 family protein [Haloarcula sp. Atlit-120R]|uniref:TIGR02391 family protein n=1 Tax=Haloarcula sp. Atlit-120R TaxID=2282135 RepID=UPI000EF2649B|nr:TIGR02391 family protein [Haloarcula sp. Atlit-120R]RLM33149.1 hypothetical protein DVK01_18330 [Haloarcula sp. Atlit-120R]